MTREEISEAISYIKAYRKLDENLHNTAPKGSVSFYALEKCLHYWDMAIEALQKDPCEDAISRQAVLDLIEHYNSDGLGSVFYGYQEGIKFAEAVNKLPPVTPQQNTEEEKEAKDVIVAKPKCAFCEYAALSVSQGQPCYPCYYTESRPNFKPNARCLELYEKIKVGIGENESKPKYITEKYYKEWRKEEGGKINESNSNNS